MTNRYPCRPPAAPCDLLCDSHLLQREEKLRALIDSRLGHALATVKAHQDIKHMPKVMTNSAKGGYKKRPRQLYGPDYKAEIEAVPAVEMTA